VAAVCYLALAFFFLELTNAVLWALPLDIGGPYAGTAAGIMNTGFGIAGTIRPSCSASPSTGPAGEIPFLLSSGLLVVGVIGSLFIDPTRKVLEPGTATALVEGGPCDRDDDGANRSGARRRGAADPTCAPSTPTRLPRSIAPGSITRCCCSAASG
jgi:hypothetical protein